MSKTTLHEKTENLWQTLNAVRMLSSTGNPLDSETMEIIEDCLRSNNLSQIDSYVSLNANSGKAINRLCEYLTYKKITAYAFERKLNISNGYLGKQLKSAGSIGSDILEKISEEYPDLNIHWLVTGINQ